MKLKHIAIAYLGGFAGVFVLLLSVVMMTADSDTKSNNINALYGNIGLWEEVSHQSLVEKYAAENGISEYVYILLAIMQVESGGTLEDVMQSSEPATIIETEVVDTNKIENFVFNFAKVYYTWDETSDSLTSRTNALQFYLTSELQTLNLDSVRADIATTSKVQAVQIWSVTQADDSCYDVVYTVSQLISDAASSSTVTSVYEVTVYVDEAGDMVITKNPTITSKPSKSDYEPKAKENDATVDATTISEISEFLTTFFRLYPTATASEIAYYANDGVMPVVGKDYTFMDLVNPLYSKTDDTVSVSLAVKYLDNKTKMVQISQFELTLQKTDSTWKIVA